MGVTTFAKRLISEFDPFDPITFGKSRRALSLNYFIPIKVSRELNWKLAARPTNVSSAHTLWAAQLGNYSEDLGNFVGTVLGPASDTVLKIPTYIYRTPQQKVAWRHMEILCPITDLQ